MSMTQHQELQAHVVVISQVDLIGMNSKLMVQYIEFVADRCALLLGSPPTTCVTRSEAALPAQAPGRAWLREALPLYQPL
jgi:hypothetical protein